MKIAPERLFLDAESQVYRVAGRKLKDSNIEYIRADLAHPEAVKRLIEAAKGALELMLTDSTCFGLGACKYYTECTRPDGECQFVLRLQAALAAVEG